MLKYIKYLKVLRHVSILTDHHHGFKLLNNFKLFSDFNEVQDYSLMMIC